MRNSDQIGSCRLPDDEPGDEPHQSWDLDIGDLRSWMRAQHTCVEQCPLLAECTDHRDKLYPRPGAGPQSVIWAGVAYGDTGQVLDRRGLRRRAATQRSRGHRAEPPVRAARVNAG